MQADSLPAEPPGKPVLALQPPILSCFSTAQPRACKLHFPAWLSTWLPGTGRSLEEAFFFFFFFFPVDLVLLLQRWGSHDRGGRGAKGKDRLRGFCQLSPDNSTLSARSSMFYSLCSFPIWRWQPLPTVTDLWEITSSHLPPALLTPSNKLPVSQSTSFAFLIR